MAIEIKILASGSSGNCYWVSDGKTPLLIECGISFKEIQKALNFKVSSLNGCLVSHSHKDHSKAVKDLLKAGVDCYMLLETARELEVANHHRVYFEGNIGLWIISSWIVQPFPAVHDVPCLGFLFVSGDDRLLYLTDSAYSTYRFPGLTHIMVGCNYDLDTLNANIDSGRVDRAAKSRLMHSHASLETVKEMLRSNDLSKLKEVYLLHLSDRNSDAEKFKVAIQSIIGVPV